MNKKIISNIVSFIIGGLIFGSIGTVFALTYKASDITYSPTDNTWTVSTVGEAINSLALSKTSDNYSIEEQVIGTWIDGKPLYRIVIPHTFTFPSSGSWTGHDTGIYISDLNIKKIIDYAGINTSDQSSSYINTSGFIKVINGKINIWNTYGAAGSTVTHLILTYTKTTDYTN